MKLTISKSKDSFTIINMANSNSFKATIDSNVRFKKITHNLVDVLDDTATILDDLLRWLQQQ